MKNRCCEDSKGNCFELNFMESTLEVFKIEVLLFPEYAFAEPQLLQTTNSPLGIASSPPKISKLLSVIEKSKIFIKNKLKAIELSILDNYR